MNLMHLETGKAVFFDKVIEMTEIAASLDIEHFFKSEKLMASERNTPLQSSLHCHLEGYNGIIQTILSIAKGIPSENEKRLLIV